MTSLFTAPSESSFTFGIASTAASSFGTASTAASSFGTASTAAFSFGTASTAASSVGTASTAASSVVASDTCDLSAKCDTAPGMTEDDTIPEEKSILTEESDLSDLVLIAEDKKLYTNRVIMMYASPVWKTMLTSDFVEKDASEIPLPGKKYDDVHQLLKCITPGITEHVTMDNADMIVPLVCEYQMEKLFEQCENKILFMIKNNEHYNITKILVRYKQAETYKLSKCLKECTRIISESSDFRQADEFKSMDIETRYMLMEKHVDYLEKRTTDLNNQLHNRRRRY